MIEYLKKRWSERSTRLGLALLAVMALKVVFPEQAAIIDGVAAALGVSVAAVPDNKPQ